MFAVLSREQMFYASSIGYMKKVLHAMQHTFLEITYILGNIGLNSKVVFLALFVTERSFFQYFNCEGYTIKHVYMRNARHTNQGVQLQLDMECLYV